MRTELKMLYDSSRQSVEYMVREITHICRNLKPRAPGSEGEREAAEYMAEVLKNDCGCDQVLVEAYKAHPDSFYGYCQISVIFYLLSSLGFFIHPIASLVGAAIALLLFLVSFVLYKPILDFLYPEKEGRNVTAILNCEGEVRRRVFLNGHIDASWEFPSNYYFGGIVFEIPNAVTFAGQLFYMTISICALCGAGSWTKTAALWGLFFLPFFIAVGFTYNPRRIVDGANDNLTGCYMGIALLNEMKKNGISLEHTDVGVLLTGSEEAGLRGAKVWSKVHENDFKDVPTFILCFDTIHDPRYLMVNEKDLNGTLTADRELGEAFVQSAKEVDVPCKKGGVPLFGGGTDAAAFVQGGFRSVGITGLNHKLEDYYHTRKDSFDNLNYEGLENCFKATIRMLEKIDAGELDGKQM